MSAHAIASAAFTLAPARLVFQPLEDLELSRRELTRPSR